MVLLNMADVAAIFDEVRGRVTLTTDDALEGASAEGKLSLAPWSGAVVAT